MEAVEEALVKFGKLEIFNTHQGRQFTSIKVTQLLPDNGIKISKGAWRDNVFVERIWRSVTYEDVSRRADARVPEARAALGRHLVFYNTRCPASTLEEHLFDRACFNQAQPIPVAPCQRQEAPYRQPKLCRQTEPPLIAHARLASLDTESNTFGLATR